jgi:hypothetical protein
MLSLLLLAAEPSRDNAISIELAGLHWNGIELLGERFVHPHISLVLGFGGRFSGGGDYPTFTLGAGFGVRFWLGRLRFFSDLGGPMASLRLDGAWTQTSPRFEAKKLETVSAVASGRLGYRFVIARRLELTPEAGFAVTVGTDGVPRPGLVLGLSAGCLF